jgi:hypothetical protein
MNFRQRTADSGQRTFKAVCLLSAVCCLLSLNAQDAPPPKDSDLVAAAKKAKAGRVTIPRKVITNADVKKAKGKLIELPSTGVKPMEPVPNTIAQHTAEMKAAAVAEKVQADATKKVADLEKELAAIEQSYYEENDPAYRDDVIKKKFEQKKTELETARAALNK